MQGCNVWNIDTGAAFTGKLTIMDIDTRQFWQSDPVKNLYPGETGRNRD
jgi:serine/threonine protein phosphatase 1